MLQHVTKTSMVKIQSWATTTEPDSEPGLVVDSINMENSPLIPGTLLVGPAQCKPIEIDFKFRRFAKTLFFNNTLVVDPHWSPSQE